MDKVASVEMPTVTGSAPRNAAATLELLAQIKRYRRDETLHWAGEQANYWYRMVSGAARQSVLTADGRRQVVDFLLPGDLFGFAVGDEHEFTVDIIAADTTIARYPRFDTERLCELDPGVGRHLCEAAFKAISRLRRHITLMGGSSAIGKVSGFLLELTSRSATAPSDTVALPMSRYDIADYLAMAVETVSRAFSVLRREETIALDGARQVWIVDRGALMRRSAPPG